MPRTTVLGSVPDVTTALAHLLFASPLPLDTDSVPAPDQVRPYVRETLMALGFTAAEQQVLTEFSDWPQESATRMCRALEAVKAAYPAPMLSGALFARRGSVSPEPTAYVQPAQRAAAWAEMARQLASTGMRAADIADALAVDENTVHQLLALAGAEAGQ